MTSSLLRQIWQRITAKSDAAPRQRLTGFEPLEPRMVLSGAAPFMMVDVFAPPPGNYSHLERIGAEYAKLAGSDYGRNADYNTPPSGSIAFIDPLVRYDDGGLNRGPSHDFDQVGREMPGADFAFTKSLTFNSLSGFNSFSDSYSSTSLTLRSEFSPSYTISVDHVMDDSDSSWISTSSSRFDGFTSLASISLSLSGSPLNAIEVRGLIPSNMNVALERRLEAREAAAEGMAAISRGPSLDASLAHASTDTTPVKTSSSTSTATAIALLATQSDGLRGSNVMQSGDGSSTTGPENNQAARSASQDRYDLDEVYAVDRRGLKRKLPGEPAALDDADREDSEWIGSTGDGDAVLLLEAPRQFDMADTTSSQMPEYALANLPADGLIDVIAADVGASMGDAKLLEKNPMALIEPAMVAYQAFEVIVDGNIQAEHRIVDAVDVANVAMADHPVVQPQ